MKPIEKKKITEFIDYELALTNSLRGFVSMAFIGFVIFAVIYFAIGDVWIFRVAVGSLIVTFIGGLIAFTSKRKHQISIFSNGIAFFSFSVLIAAFSLAIAYNTGIYSSTLVIIEVFALLIGCLLGLISTRRSIRRDIFKGGAQLANEITLTSSIGLAGATYFLLQRLDTDSYILPLGICLFTISSMFIVLAATIPFMCFYYMRKYNIK